MPVVGRAKRLESPSQTALTYQADADNSVCESPSARTGLPAHPLTLCMGRKPYVTSPWRSRVTSIELDGCT